jgi:hypothetical protein
MRGTENRTQVQFSVLTHLSREWRRSLSPRPAVARAGRLRHAWQPAPHV